MSRYLPSLLLTAVCGLPPALAQALEIPDVVYPAVVEHAESPESFVPAGWRLEHIAHGRLDADDLEDAILVLRMDDPANIISNGGYGPKRFDTNPRMLLAVVALPDGTWRQVMRNHHLVPRPESPVMDDYLGDDPAGAVTIRSNRTWSVALHGWASAGTWSMRSVGLTFRFEGGCMRLVGYDNMHLHRATGETVTTSVNYLTGRAWIQPGSISDDEPRAQRPARLASQARLCIEDVGDGLEFTPDLLSG